MYFKTELNIYKFIINWIFFKRIFSPKYKTRKKNVGKLIEIEEN